MATNNSVHTEEPELPRVQGPSRIMPSLIAGIFLGVILAFLLAGFLWLSTGFGLSHLMSLLGGGHIRINVDQPTVVRQIQQLQRLETVSYTMDKIISGGHQSRWSKARRCPDTRAEGFDSPADGRGLQHANR